MKTVRVHGKRHNHKILVYAISTCAWCRKAKNFLKDNDIEYEYVDVDMCSNEDREKIREDILKMGGRSSFPTIIIDDKILITGFHEEDLKKALEI